MGRGVSIHIGLNTLDAGHYSVGGELLFEQLEGCVNDAVLMQRIAKSRNFDTELFVTTENEETNREKLATEKIFERIRFHKEQLGEGDFFLLTFAGHGSQIDNFGSDFELSGNDQTMCFYDRMVIDDELSQLWSSFNPGVRILVISDSCHSGTVFFAALMETMIFSEVATGSNFSESLIIKRTLFNVIKSRLNTGKHRKLRDGAGMELFMKHQVKYSEIFQKLSQALADKGVETFNSLIKCSLLKLSACQDHEKAEDGAINGVFTTALKKIWFGTETPTEGQIGGFAGSYLDFFKLVRQKTNSKNNSQRPKFFETTAEALGKFPQMNETRLDNFMKSKPFEI